MKKGIAIRTILLILVGVIVAGTIVYLVYKYVSGSVITEAECHIRLTESCIACKNKEWADDWPGGSSDFFEKVEECCSEYAKFSSFCGKNNCDELEDPCMMFGVQ